MAVAREPGDPNQFIAFLAGGTPTPISHRFRLPSELIASIAGEFADSGTPSMRCVGKKYSSPDSRSAALVGRIPWNRRKRSIAQEDNKRERDE
jgi:hypothetical protein